MTPREGKGPTLNLSHVIQALICDEAVMMHAEDDPRAMLMMNDYREMQQDPDTVFMLVSEDSVIPTETLFQWGQAIDDACDVPVEGRLALDIPSNGLMVLHPDSNVYWRLCVVTH